MLAHHIRHPLRCSPPLASGCLLNDIYTRRHHAAALALAPPAILAARTNHHDTRSAPCLLPATLGGCKYDAVERIMGCGRPSSMGQRGLLEEGCRHTAVVGAVKGPTSRQVSSWSITSASTSSRPIKSAAALHSAPGSTLAAPPLLLLPLLLLILAETELRMSAMQVVGSLLVTLRPIPVVRWKQDAFQELCSRAPPTFRPLK